MAHKVSLKLLTNVVTSKDFEVVIKTIDNEKTTTLGRLMISKGNIEWSPGGNSVNKKRFTWLKFADLMMEGKTVRAKPRKKKAKAGE